jgi:hypothetical protein
VAPKEALEAVLLKPGLDPVPATGDARTRGPGFGNRSSA